MAFTVGMRMVLTFIAINTIIDEEDVAEEAKEESAEEADRFAETNNVREKTKQKNKHNEMAL